MKSILFPSSSHLTSSTRVSVGLLAIRLLMGVAFVAHGAGKIASPFNWMGPDAPVPGIFQALAALAEVGGGAALIVGLLTPLASLGLVVTMAVAVLFHLMQGDAFVGGYELASVYLVLSGFLLASGPGRFSLDHALSKRSQESRSQDLIGTEKTSVASI